MNKPELKLFSSVVLYFFPLEIDNPMVRACGFTPINIINNIIANVAR